MAASVTLYGIVNPGGSMDSEISLLVNLTYPLTIQSGVQYVLPSNSLYTLHYNSANPTVVSYYYQTQKQLDFTLTGNQYICTFDLFDRSTVLNKLFFGNVSYQLPAIVRAAYLQGGTQYRIAMEVNEPYSDTNSISNVFLNGVSYAASLYPQARLANGNTVYRVNAITGTPSPVSITYKRGTYTSAPITTSSFGPPFTSDLYHVANTADESNVTQTYRSPIGAFNLKSVIIVRAGVYIGTYPIIQSGEAGYTGIVGTGHFCFTRPHFPGTFSLVYISHTDSVAGYLYNYNFTPTASTVSVIAVSPLGIRIQLTPGNTSYYPVTSFLLDVTASDGYTETITLAGNGTSPLSYTYTNVNIGVGYRFRVITYTHAGISPQSAFQDYTIIQVAPEAPTDVSVVAGDGQAEVSFTAPVSDGGSAITEYKVYNAANDTLLSYGAASPITVTGLTNGTSYSVYVIAVNAIGESVESDGSTLFTPTGTPVCFFGNAPVLTPSGYKRMDSLKVGDKVMNANGTAATIQHVEIMVCQAGKHSNPYVLEKGQFGATERVFISPDHKIAHNGKMVKAKDLHLPREEMTGMLKYYNIAIEGSSNMVVAGVEVESLSPITHTVITVEQLVDVLHRKYGSKLTSEEITKKVLRTCRILKDGRVEVPILRTK